MPLTDEQIERARALQTEGWSWRRIGDLLGIHNETLRRNCDPAYAEHRKAKDRKRVRDRGTTGVHATRNAVEPNGEHRERFRAEIGARLAEIPPDTRSLTARAFGDPIFERSALYRKMQEDYDLDCEGAR